MTIVDFILEISYPTSAGLDDRVQSSLYLSASTGNSSSDVDGRTIVTAYFDSAHSRAAATEMLRDAGLEWRTDERERVDWLERYQQSLEPLFIGRSFAVAPDGALLPEGGKRLRIIVPQEQAFGTGSHETTSLSMEMLETIGAGAKRGLDIGSGTGILAIAMHLLGVEKVIAFDNDADAYAALRDNRRRNGVPDRAMPIFIGSVEALRGGAFDVITMNIIPEVIIALLPQVMARMSGDLILSGILTARRDDVIAAARSLRLVDESSRGEWWCGRFQIPAASSVRPGSE